MTIFTAGAPNIVTPAKAGVHFYCLNHSSMIAGATFRVASTSQARGGQVPIPRLPGQRYESD
jgi:hypothetical protein